MPKRIVVYEPNGTERELPALPTLREMQSIVGGYIEHVTVLDRMERGYPIYTVMYVNEDGLNDGLARNDKATEIYQRNARYQHPSAENPFKAMDDQQQQIWQSAGGATIIDVRPPAYVDDPWIAGPAIVFEGWDCAEVNRVYGG